ncbi:hypothetical protein BN903_54 [Halorubrum sp. AJ67]|nr:hypothetical protein BN903_54 [Halorubrum sp. AJ67]
MTAFERGHELRRRAEPGDPVVVDVGVAVDRRERELLHLERVHLPVQQVVREEEAPRDREQRHPLAVPHLLGELEAVRPGRDDDRLGVEVAVVGLDEEPVPALVDVRHGRAEVNGDALLRAGGVDERLRDRAVVDHVAVGRLERLQLRAGVAPLDDLRLQLFDLLAADLAELREQVAEPVLAVALLQLGDLLVADAEDHLAPLAVHLAVGVFPFEVAREQLRALLDLLRLL